MLIVEPKPQCGQHYNANANGRPAIAIERNAQHAHCGHKRDVAAPVALVGIAFVDGPQHDAHQQDDVDDFARIEGAAQRVDEEQLKPSAHGDDARHDAIEHAGHNNERNCQGDERAFEFDVGEFAIAEHQHDGRNAKQVQQVHADAQARHIGDEDEPAIAVRLVGMVFPFQNEPEHNRGERRRIGIHLAFDSREPKGVAEGVDQRAH